MLRGTRIDGPGAFAAAFGVSRETIERLETYEALLKQWQKAVNLVAPASLDQVWHRHFADSAQLARLVPERATTLVDLGSGAGFPGLVLAIMQAESPPNQDSDALNPDSNRPNRVRITLIESDQRKSAFLAEVARRLSLPVNILSTRIENRETQSRVGTVDVVTARALAPLTALLAWSSPLMHRTSIGLFPKGRMAEAELAAAAAVHEFKSELVESVTEAAARIVVVREVGGAQGA